jgi:predicted Zn-dependent protease
MRQSSVSTILFERFSKTILMPNITALTALLDKGQDSALLRFGLASAYLKEQPDDHLIQAEQHLKRCLELDPTYTAAYQQLAQVQKDRENLIDATATLRFGIAAAESAGDLQAQRVMQVFLKRLAKRLDAGSPGQS